MKKLFLITVVFLGIFFLPKNVYAKTTITVCNSGCDYSNFEEVEYAYMDGNLTDKELIVELGEGSYEYNDLYRYINSLTINGVSKKNTVLQMVNSNLDNLVLNNMSVVDNYGSISFNNKNVTLKNIIINFSDIEEKWTNLSLMNIFNINLENVTVNNNDSYSALGSTNVYIYFNHEYTGDSNVNINGLTINNKNKVSYGLVLDEVANANINNLTVNNTNVGLYVHRHNDCPLQSSVIVNNSNLSNNTCSSFNVLDDGKQVFEQESISLTLNPTSSYANQESFDVTAKVINESGFLEDIYPGVYTTSFLPIMVLEQENQIDYISHIYIVSDDYLKLNQEIQELVENNKIYYANYPAMYHNQVVTSNCIKLIIYLALLFITFITVVSIIGTISASLNLRRKEFAILKSIGLSNKQFNKMIFYESLMLSLKSLLFGILLFILIVSIFIKITMINDATYEGLLQIPLNIYLMPLLICVIGVIVIVYLSFLIATHKMKKDNIVDIIKYY